MANSTPPSYEELKAFWTYTGKHQPSTQKKWIMFKNKESEKCEKRERMMMGIEDTKIILKECPICMEDFQEDKTYMCPNGHVASCFSCAKKMCGMNIPNGCPVCRRPNTINPSPFTKETALAFCRNNMDEIEKCRLMGIPSAFVCLETNNTNDVHHIFVIAHITPKYVTYVDCDTNRIFKKFKTTISSIMNNQYPIIKINGVKVCVMEQGFVSFQ
jgi:hypothetical protein